MYKLALTIIWRRIFIYPWYFLIRVAGLTMGLLAILIIWAFVLDPFGTMFTGSAVINTCNLVDWLIFFSILLTMEAGYVLLSIKMKVYKEMYNVGRWIGGSQKSALIFISSDTFILHLFGMLFSFIMLDTVLESNTLGAYSVISLRNTGSIVYWGFIGTIIFTATLISSVSILLWQRYLYRGWLYRRNSD